jgi:hypothetical protein
MFEPAGSIDTPATLEWVANVISIFEISTLFIHWSLQVVENKQQQKDETIEVSEPCEGRESRLFTFSFGTRRVQEV